MPYIDTKYLFKCETCGHYQNDRCRTFCEHGESYSPNMSKIPTADVVPRAEIEISQHLLKGAYKRIEELDKLCGELQKAKSDVAREIFEEIEKALNLSKCYGNSGIYFEHDIETDIADLKKKYTGAAEPQGGEKV